MSGKGALPRSFMVEETDGCVASAEINQIREKREVKLKTSIFIAYFNYILMYFFGDDTWNS